MRARSRIAGAAMALSIATAVLAGPNLPVDDPGWTTLRDRVAEGRLCRSSVRRIDPHRLLRDRNGEATGQCDREKRSLGFLQARHAEARRLRRRRPPFRDSACVFNVA